MIKNKLFISKSIYAGILIGIGDVVFLSLDNKIIAAMLFSLGLLTIILQQLNLYTGKIGLLNNSIIEYIGMFVGNTIGIMSVLGMIYISKPDLIVTAIDIANKKFGHSVLELMILGILCGMCMYIAVSSKNQLITVFAIMVFILCGFEHCIADIFYFTLISSWSNILKLISIVFGNSIGAIILHSLNGE